MDDGLPDNCGVPGEGPLLEVRLGDRDGDDARLTDLLGELAERVEADSPCEDIGGLLDLQAQVSCSAPASFGPGRAALDEAIRGFEARESRLEVAPLPPSSPGRPTSPPMGDHGTSPAAVAPGIAEDICRGLTLAGVDWRLNPSGGPIHILVIDNSVINNFITHRGQGPLVTGDGFVDRSVKSGGDAINVNTGDHGKATARDVFKQTIDSSTRLDVDVRRVLKEASDRIVAGPGDDDVKEDAARDLQRLKEELEKPEPDRSRVRLFFEKIRAALPDVALILESARTIADFVRGVVA